MVSKERAWMGFGSCGMLGVQMIPGVPAIIGYILAIGGFGGMAIVLLWDNLPRRDGLSLGWDNRLPLWEAAYKARKALNNTELSALAEKFEDNGNLSQLTYVASHLSNDYDIYTRSIFGEWKNHGSKLISLNEGRSVHGLKGTPYIDKNSLREFVRSKKNGNR